MILKDIRMKRGVDMNGSLFGNNNLDVESLEFDEDNNDIPTDVSIPEEYLEQSSSVSENKLISENNIIQESQINNEKDNGKRNETRHKCFNFVSNSNTKNIKNGLKWA